MRPHGAMITAAAAAVLAAGCASLEPGAYRIDRAVEAERLRQGVPGVSVAVISHGEVRRLAGYGEANVEHRVPATASTVFESGSVGKQFTAAAVLLAVADGKLALDDPVTRFFPDAPAAWRPITVRHLLAHTSGIPDYDEETIDVRRDYGDDELARFAYALPLEFAAGTRWNYSNTGYVLLGILVKRATGRHYADILRERVFVPLGMTSARLISEDDIVPNRAAGYRRVDGQLKNQEWVSPSLNTTADGSLYLSAADMVGWNAGIRSEAILGREAWDATFTPVRLASGRTFPYGFGWEIDEVAGRRRIHHDGAWQGFTAAIARYPDDDLAIAVFCNAASADPNRFVDVIAALFDVRLAPPPLVAIPDPEPEIAVRLRELLRKTAAGSLSREELAYVRAPFFKGAAARYQRELAPLGDPTQIALLERRELGDDVVRRYRVDFGAKVFRVTLGIAPDGKISLLSIREEPER